MFIGERITLFLAQPRGSFGEIDLLIGVAVGKLIVIGVVQCL